MITSVTQTNRIQVVKADHKPADFRQAYVVTNAGNPAVQTQGSSVVTISDEAWRRFLTERAAKLDFDFSI